MFLFRSKESRPISPPRARDKDAPLLHDLILEADIRELRRLADKHGPANITQMICATDSLGRNALHVACEDGDDDVIRNLIKFVVPKSLTAAINARDASGAPPVFVAVRCGAKLALRELAKNGADVAMVDNNRSTAYHAPFDAPFTHKGHASIIKELTTMKQIDINAVNSKGVTALQIACEKGAYDCAKALLAGGADPTIFKGGQPPLFSAVIANNPALVRILLEAGADVGQSNAQGQALMEVINPKCEIYRIIKQFLINRPGGARKLNLISEEAIVATKVTDLPTEVARLVERSGLSQSEIETHWAEFVPVIRLVAKKRLVATAEEAVAIDEKKGQHEKEQAKEAEPQLLAQLATSLMSSGDPKKIFKKMRIAGGGGFGMVFQGTGPDKKEWAIKRMANNSPMEKLSNLREANFLKECNHKNICAYKATYDCPSEHEMWLVMELLRGGTLDESVGSNSDVAQAFFEERHLAFTAAEIMRGLEYLHGRSVVHRDLKSQNIMFTLDGEVKIIDFGAAISIADTTKVHKDIIGSPYWMPPEMILRKPHGWQVDIWSSAVCIIELANRRPPDNSSVLRHLFHTATGKHTWLDKPDAWSDLMRNFLEQCMQFDPAARPRAAVLLRHKWCSVTACNQAEMSKLLHKIFAVRAYGDV